MLLEDKSCLIKWFVQLWLPWNQATDDSADVNEEFNGWRGKRFWIPSMVIFAELVCQSSLILLDILNFLFVNCLEDLGAVMENIRSKQVGAV